MSHLLLGSALSYLDCITDVLLAKGADGDALAILGARNRIARHLDECSTPAGVGAAHGDRSSASSTADRFFNDEQLDEGREEMRA